MNEHSNKRVLNEFGDQDEINRINERLIRPVISTLASRARSISHSTIAAAFHQTEKFLNRYPDQSLYFVDILTPQGKKDKEKQISWQHMASLGSLVLRYERTEKRQGDDSDRFREKIINIICEEQVALDSTGILTPIERPVAEALVKASISIYHKNKLIIEREERVKSKNRRLAFGVGVIGALGGGLLLLDHVSNKKDTTPLILPTPTFTPTIEPSPTDRETSTAESTPTLSPSYTPLPDKLIYTNTEWPKLLEKYGLENRSINDSLLPFVVINDDIDIPQVDISQFMSDVEIFMKQTNILVNGHGEFLSGSGGNTFIDVINEGNSILIQITDLSVAFQEKLIIFNKSQGQWQVTTRYTVASGTFEETAEIGPDGVLIVSNSRKQTVIFFKENSGGEVELSAMVTSIR